MVVSRLFFRRPSPSFLDTRMITPSFVFSLLAAVISAGTIFIKVGGLNGKVAQNTDTNAAQDKKIEDRATKEDLAQAVTRADEHLTTAIKHLEKMLEVTQRLAEEDRALEEGRYRELRGIIDNHGERIKAVETTQKAIDRSLEEIKSDIKTGFAEVKTEIRELRSQG